MRLVLRTIPLVNLNSLYWYSSEIHLFYFYHKFQGAIWRKNQSKKCSECKIEQSWKKTSRKQTQRTIEEKKRDRWTTFSIHVLWITIMSLSVYHLKIRRYLFKNNHKKFWKSNEIIILFCRPWYMPWKLALNWFGLLFGRLP